MRDPRDSVGQRRAALVKADDLLQQIDRCLQAVAGDDAAERARYQTGAGEQITFLRQRIARELQTLPRPN